MAPSDAHTRRLERAERLRERARFVSRLPLSMMLACVFLALATVQLVFQLGNMAYRSVKWSQETALVTSRADALEREIEFLTAAVAAHDDPAYLRQLARCRGFVGVDERVVVAQVEAQTEAQTEAQPTQSESAAPEQGVAKNCEVATDR